MQKEKTSLIEQLETERSLSARTPRTPYTPTEIWGLDRPQPTGISEDDVDQNEDTSSVYEEKIKQVNEEIRQMKREIKEKEERQKLLIESFKVSKSCADVKNSQLCIVQ